MRYSCATVTHHPKTSVDAKTKGGFLLALHVHCSLVADLTWSLFFVGQGDGPPITEYCQPHGRGQEKVAYCIAAFKASAQKWHSSLVWLIKQVMRSSLVSVQWVMWFSCSGALWGYSSDWKGSQKWHPDVLKCLRDAPPHAVGYWAKWCRCTADSSATVSSGVHLWRALRPRGVWWSQRVKDMGPCQERSNLGQGIASCGKNGEHCL